MMKKIVLLGLCVFLFSCCAADGPAGGATGDSGVTGTTPSADTTAPVPGSGGLVSYGSTQGSILIGWPEASDGITGRLLLEYRVYFSASSNIGSVAEATNNGMPGMVWTRNIQEWLVTGLAPTNTYYFTVLVRDQAGNIAAHVPIAASTALPGGQVKTVQIAGHLVRFRYCPGGLAPVESDSVLSNIAPFWIGETEVPYGLWHAVYTWATNNGYVFAYAGCEGSSGALGALPTTASNQPAINMNWRDALIWCNAASEMAGLVPAYFSTVSGPVVRHSTNRADQVNGVDNAATNPSGSGIRFTTRNEWFCAARYHDGIDWTPGSYVSGAWGISGAMMTNYAWYNDNSGGASHEVGLLLPNEVGCYDMVGNVAEFFFSTTPFYQKQAGSCIYLDNNFSCKLETVRTIWAHDKGWYGFRLAITTIP